MWIRSAVFVAAALTAVLAAGARLLAAWWQPKQSRHQRAFDVAFWGARMPDGDGRFWRTLCLGVLVMTVTTPSLSNFALFRLPFAAYCALTSLGPMWAVPVLWVAEGQRPTLRGLAGAALAALGAFWVSMASREGGGM